MAQPSSLQSGVRFRALPTQEQTHVLGQWIGCQRFIYNGKIDEDRLFAAQRRMALRGTGLWNAQRHSTSSMRSSRRLS